MVISTIINNSLNYSFLVYLSYFAIAISLFLLNHTHKLLVIHTMIAVISICVIMGFIDPKQQFMPGFLTECYDWSLQFYNPNHIGYVISIIEVLIVGLFVNTQNLKLKIYYLINFLIIGLYIFLNSSFAPILAIFLGLIIYLIYYWVKNKKFPLQIFASIIILLFLSAMVDSIVYLRTYRFASYGFMEECLTRFDAIFGTNILGAMGGIPNANLSNFDRLELWSQSLVYIGESFLFGKGAGFSEKFRPHNEFFYLAVDFGLIAGLIYIAVFVLLIIYTCKNKQKSFIAIPLLISIISYYFSGIFGNITSHSFIYLMVVVGLLVSENKKDNV